MQLQSVRLHKRGLVSLGAHELPIKEQKPLMVSFILRCNTPARSVNGVNGCIQNMSQSSKDENFIAQQCFKCQLSCRISVVLQWFGAMDRNSLGEDTWTAQTWVIVTNTHGLSLVLVYLVNFCSEKGKSWSLPRTWERGERVSRGGSLEFWTWVVFVESDLSEQKHSWGLWAPSLKAFLFHSRDGFWGPAGARWEEGKKLAIDLRATMLKGSNFVFPDREVWLRYP